MKNDPYYFGWCDESRQNKSRFRSVALISHTEDIKDKLIQGLRDILNNHNKKEIRLSDLKDDVARDTIEDIFNFIFEILQRNKIINKLRIDILIWDIQDSRHLIKGRDDVNNLQRMYFHLFKNVLINRWKKGQWIIYPDENSAIGWNEIRNFFKKD